MQAIKDVSVYQTGNCTYIVLKDFYKRGSAICAFTKEQLIEAQTLATRCALLASGNTQSVVLFGENAPTIYAEYFPYWKCSEREMINIARTGDCPGEPLVSSPM